MSNEEGLKRVGERRIILETIQKRHLLGNWLESNFIQKDATKDSFKKTRKIHLRKPGR